MNIYKDPNIAFVIADEYFINLVDRCQLGYVPLNINQMTVKIKRHSIHS